MEHETDSEAAAIDSLRDIIPDNSLNMGQADDAEVVTKPEPLIKEEPEVKPEVKTEVEPEDFEIEVDGEKYKVPAKLKDKFMFQADYTKKTMALAEKEKSLAQADPKEIEQLKQRVTQFEALALQSLPSNEHLLNQINQELLTTDVNADPIRVLQLSQHKAQVEARINEGRAVSTRFETENTERHSQSLKQEWEQLLAKRPEWKDEAVRKDDRVKLEKFLTESGYSKADVDAIGDHRALLVADDARRYRELMAAKSETVKRIEKLPPKIERPGVPSGEEGQGGKPAMDALRKSGKVDDAAAAIRSLMG